MDGNPSLAHIERGREEQVMSLCREKIPPSKEMIMQLDTLRKMKRELEGKGKTTSQQYLYMVKNIKILEKRLIIMMGKDWIMVTMNA